MIVPAGFGLTPPQINACEDDEGGGDFRAADTAVRQDIDGDELDAWG